MPKFRKIAYNRNMIYYYFSSQYINCKMGHCELLDKEGISNADWKVSSHSLSRRVEVLKGNTCTQEGNNYMYLLKDLISDTPCCLLYNSSISSQNLVLKQLIIPELTFLFNCITNVCLMVHWYCNEKFCFCYLWELTVHQK